MKAEIATEIVIPSLMKKLGIKEYTVENFALHLEKGSLPESTFKEDAGDKYYLVLEPPKCGIKISSSNGYYDANSPFGPVKEEVHTGQLEITNYLATQETIELIRVQPHH